MRFDVITIFPDLVTAYLNYGVIGGAAQKGVITVTSHDLRNYGKGNYKQVDDRPFGGGAGMLLMFEPIAAAISDIKAQYEKLGISSYQTVATSAGGKLYKQSTAKNLSKYEAMIVLCGRYEGFDQRIIDTFVDLEISIGNFVVSGGELPALLIIDSIARLLPGVLNKQESYEHDSFYTDDNTIQYPQYTRPENVTYNGSILSVPPILLSGNHADIANWRKSHLTTAEHQ